MARASPRRSKATSASRPTRPVPATEFVEASGKAFNTIRPNDYTFFEMINANVQDEPALDSRTAFYYAYTLGSPA